MSSIELPLPPRKRARRGSRSPLASLRRRIIQALRQADLHNLVEVTVIHGILLMRPVSGIDIDFGYPRSQAHHGLHPSHFNCPASITNPLEHVSWAQGQDFSLCQSLSLPTMLRASAAVQRSLSRSEINSLRQSNKLALEAWLQSSTDRRNAGSGVQLDANASANHWNLQHIQQLMDITNHPDLLLVNHLAQGFPITGEIPGGGIFPAAPTARPSKWQATDLVVDNAGLIKLATYLDKTDNDLELASAVIADVEEEIAAGRALGSFSILGRPDSLEFASPLFGVKQRDKIRLISNYSFRVSGKKFNEASSVSHKVQLPRLAHVALLLEELRVSETDIVHLARIDHQSAYRQLPIPMRDAMMAAGMYRTVKGDHRLVVPLVCPFGAVGSVTAYLRVAEFHCHLMRCLGFSNCFSYMDDFFPVEFSDCSSSALDFFNFLNYLTGAKIKHSKTILPSEDTELLGLRINLLGGRCTVTLTPLRQARLLTDLTNAASNPSLIDSKFAGRLSFACEALFGRLGRGPVRLLIRHSLGLHIDNTKLQHSLSLLVHLFSCSIFKRNLRSEVSLPSVLPFICYADASTSYGIGVFAPQQFSVPALVGSLDLHHIEAHINLLELVAAASCIETCKFWFGDRPVLLFTDSTTCESLILKGSSSSDLLGRSISLFWRRLAELRIMYIFVAHVRTDLNIADSLSRGLDFLATSSDSSLVTVKLPPWWSAILPSLA